MAKKIGIKALIIFVILCVILLAVRFFSGEDNWICDRGVWVMHGRPIAPKPNKPCIQRKETSMKLTSAEFNNNGKLPVKFTCDGQGIAPELIISGIPGEAKSLVLTIDDPDAVRGSFNHFLAWNIPPLVSTLNPDKLLPGAVIGKNSAGSNSYAAPCPPNGTHRYIFSLMAIDTQLNLPSFSDRSSLTKAMENHILEETSLTGLFR